MLMRSRHGELLTIALWLVFACSSCSSENFHGEIDGNADSLDGADSATTDGTSEQECTRDDDCDDLDPCTTDLCDDTAGECQHGPPDEDHDGYIAMVVDGNDCGGTDCDDGDGLIFPGRPVVQCSPVDNDCNGYSDEDNDGDGHLDWTCDGGDDCDDSDPDVLRGECWGESACCDGCNQINGCWLDETTGYIWEDPAHGGEMRWESAVEYCEMLSLAGMGVGEWHLPTISELRTLIRGCPDTEAGGACGVTDSCFEDSCSGDCEGCAAGEGPGAGGCYWDHALEGGLDWYWSSTRFEPHTNNMWYVRSGDASISYAGDANRLGVRCVNTGA